MHRPTLAKRVLRIFLLAVAGILLLGCTSKTTGPAEEAQPLAAPTPEPRVKSLAELAAESGVIAVVELPSGDSLGEATTALVNGVVPGSSFAIAAQLTKLLGGMLGDVPLASIDLGQPVRIIVPNPEVHRPVLLVHLKSGALSNDLGKGAIAEGGMALIGSPESLAATRSFAFDTLAKRQKALTPRAILFVKPAMQAAEKSFTQFRAAFKGMGDEDPSGEQLRSFLIEFYEQMLVAAPRELEEVELTVVDTLASPGLSVRFIARPDTEFAQFCRIQRPSQYLLLRDLPKMEKLAGFAGGSLAFGELRESFVDLLDNWMMKERPREDRTRFRKLMTELMTLYDGDFAGAFLTLQPVPIFVQLFGTTDGKRAMALNLEMAKLNAGITNFLGVEQQVTFKPAAFTYKGIEVAEQESTTDMGELAKASGTPSVVQQTMFWATVGDLMGIAPTAEMMRSLIDTAGGAGARLELDEPGARALDASKARGDSLFMRMKTPAGTEYVSVVTLGLGFDERSASIFVGLN